MKIKEINYDAIILGAGASGLMAAISAGKNKKRVLIIDHSKIIGHKLLVSGGGKCNVTNTKISSNDYYGKDITFCKSILKNFNTKSTLQLLSNASIKTEEREHGRIFCKYSAKELVLYLKHTAENLGVDFAVNTPISNVLHDNLFSIKCHDIVYKSPHLLIATGGPSWPQIGATDFGCRLAKQFGHKIIPLRPALTGLILPQNSPLLNLQGISLDVQIKVTGKDNIIAEPLLFTHKGLSGPSILQASCFWEKGDMIIINFLPIEDANSLMHNILYGKLLVKNLYARFLPDRLMNAIIPFELLNRKVAELSKKDRKIIAESIHAFTVIPSSLEGFSKAEATLGGVSTNEIDPRTMESFILPGLFFSGEVVDITGKLGGYNIHWAFASGFTAGQFL